VSGNRHGPRMTTVRERSLTSGHATTSGLRGSMLDQQRGHTGLRVDVVAAEARPPSGGERAVERETSAVAFGRRAK